MMTNRKKLGGPKTPEGKAKVSKNALKHSLSTAKASGPSEQQNIDLYSQRLIDYYDTQDPLEILQLQRIALYREKLSKVYQAETAAAKLAEIELKNNPAAVFKNMTHLHAVSRGMVIDFIRWEGWFLPCGLEVKDLRQICQEIDLLAANVKNENDFYRYLPTLANVLNGRYPDSAKQELTIAQKLQATAQRIEEVFASGEKYCEGIRPILEEFTNAQEQSKKVQSSPNDKDEDDELEQYIQARQASLRSSRKNKTSTTAEVSQTHQSPFPGADLIQKQLQVFTQLLVYHQLALYALDHFEQTQALMLETLSLPSPQSDLLLRYQTTWERRLSAAIGELMELQKRNRQ